MGKDIIGQNISKEDANKLYSLFRKGPRKGGLNNNDTDAEYIRNFRAYTSQKAIDMLHS
jgi:hypothetical protein